jgi:hypothetical protein
MSTTLIERINAIIETGEVSRAGLARAAGLHPNSLRKLGQSDWNPTADTLGRLEKLIQAGNTEVLVGPELSQGIRVEAGGAGEAGTADLAGFDDRVQLLDEGSAHASPFITFECDEKRRMIDF